MATYVAEAGEFTRDTNYIGTRITTDGRDGYPVQPAAVGTGKRYFHWVLRPYP
jgi:hypothetical protein